MKLHTAALGDLELRQYMAQMDHFEIYGFCAHHFCNQQGKYFY